MLNMLQDQNFLKRLKKFKEKWLNERRKEETSESLDKTATAIKSRNKSIRKTCKRLHKQCITTKPAGVLKKNNAISPRSITNLEENSSKYLLEKRKMTKNSNVALGKNCSRSKSQAASNSKQKCRRKKKNSYGKSSKLQNVISVESSSESSSSLNNFQNDITFNKQTSIHDTFSNDKKNENIQDKNLKRSSFYLRSSKLLPNIKPNNSNIADPYSSFAISNSFEIESSEFTSSEVSFSVRRFKWKNNSVAIQNHAHTSNSTNNCMHASNDRFYEPPDIQRNEIFPKKFTSSLISKSGNCKRNEDSENVITSSHLKHKKRIIANAFLRNTDVCDIERRTRSFVDLSRIPQKFIEGEGRDSAPRKSCKEVQKHSKINYEQHLVPRNNDAQWCTFPDSLESALTTSMEKLEEIKNLF